MAQKRARARTPSRRSRNVAAKIAKKAKKPARAATRRRGKDATHPKPQRRGKLSFLDRLSRLTFYTACRLLGEQGDVLIRRGGARFDNIRPQEARITP